jgi:imidazole glycerol phosphate synthase glutamine amidotransferase subunit
MEAPEVAIIRTGVSNAASVMAALRRAGARPFLSDEAERVAAAPFAVLPGVGAFGPAAKALRERGLDEALRWRFSRGLPLLGICLGMQLCFEASEESPGVPGLSLFPGCVGRFRGAESLPQLGWNRVGAGSFLLGAGWAYFANSYRLDEAPAGFGASWSSHGEPFVAALESPGPGSLLLCQYHPELSGAFGLSLLGRWLGTEPRLAGKEDES